MKKQLSILLLFCYALVFLKPVIPVLSDCLAHIFWRSNHVATVHFEDGKYHLHVEVKKAAEEIPAQKKQNTVAEQTVHVQAQTIERFSQPETFVRILFPPVQHTLRMVYQDVPVLPPWNC